MTNVFNVLFTIFVMGDVEAMQMKKEIFGELILLHVVSLKMDFTIEL